MHPASAGGGSRSRYTRATSGEPSEGSNIRAEWRKQLTAYVQWVNSQLKKKPGAHLVEDLRHDLRDGVALIDLIEVIADEVLPDVNRAPSTLAEMRENVDKVLQFMHTREIKMHHINTRDIVEGNLKAIMRLILALAVHYKPNSVRHSSHCNKNNIAGIAQGASAALAEARRNVTRAGHRYRRRRPKEDPMDRTDRRVIGEDRFVSGGKWMNVDGRAELEGASANSSPTSSHNNSPRASLYLSEPSSSMEGLLAVNSTMHRGGIMMTSCESDSALGDSGFSEICDSLKEAHEMLVQLHELLLSGDGPSDAKLQPGWELECANPRETIILLKGRLLHAEEVAESLRADLNRVKKDCLELQGTKAGLQQRLKEQESSLSGLTAEAMRLELEREKLLLETDALKKQLAGTDQVLSDVKLSCVKQVEDKDRIIGDLRRELLKRDHLVNHLQEQVNQLKGGLGRSRAANDDVGNLVAGVRNVDVTGTVRELDLRYQEERISVLTNCLSRLAESDKPGVLKTTDFEVTRDMILQTRPHTLVNHVSGSKIDQLEDVLVKLLDKMHVNGSGTNQASGSQHFNREHNSATAKSRSGVSVPQNWRHSGSRDTPKVAPQGHTQSSPSSDSSGWGLSARNIMNDRQGHSRGNHVPPQTYPGMHGNNSHTANVGRTTHSQAPRPHDAQTNVIYYTDKSDKPLTCVIYKQLGEIRLSDFKSQIGDSGLYHYFFKSLDPEYGTVKEELSCDDDILPGWEGKIVAWLEGESGTAC